MGNYNANQPFDIYNPYVPTDWDTLSLKDQRRWLKKWVFGRYVPSAYDYALMRYIERLEQATRNAPAAGGDGGEADGAS